MPQDSWQAWVDRSSVGDEAYIALAEADDGPIGMAGGYRPEEAPDERGLWGMWVDPLWRGTGIGYRLLVAVEDWAARAGAERLVLWVVESNASAVTLYRKAGFVETGETQALPSDESLHEIQLAKPIGPVVVQSDL